jgi:hypothetical protein
MATTGADAVRLGQQAGTDGIAAEALAVRSLAAMARDDWSSAGDLACQARAALRLAGEESYIAPLVCAAEARVAIHHGDVEAAQRHLVSAQRTGDVDLPQARRLLTERGGHPVQATGATRRVNPTRAIALGEFS